MLEQNTWNYLIQYRQISLGSFETFTYKISIYKSDISKLATIVEGDPKAAFSIAYYTKV